MTCPSGDIGPEADAALGSILRMYSEESGAAGLNRFHESDVDQLDAAAAAANVSCTHATLTGSESFADVAAVAHSQGSSSSGNSAPSHAAPGQAIKVHYLLVTQSQASQIKLFKLRQLPVGHLERTLSSLAPTVRNAVGYGFTARLVRWNATSEEYVFNGRSGAATRESDAQVSELFEKTFFQPLQDSRPHVPTAEEQQNVSMGNGWRVKGQKPTVRDFLAGIGETEFVDPNQVQEMPADTKNLMAQSGNGPITTVGRARVPKARTGSISSSDESDAVADYRDEAEPSSALLAQAFSSLLGPSSKAKVASDVGSDSESEGRDDKRMSFAALLGGPSRKAQASTASTTGSMNLKAHGHDQVAVTSQVKHSTVTPPLSTNAEQTINSENTLPVYSKKYAAVDRHGLMSVASLQAEWETENISHRRQKPSKSGITSRRAVTSHPVMSPPPTEDGNTATAPLSNFSSPQRGQTSGSSRSISVQSNSSREQIYRQPWTTMTPPRCLPQGELVDVSAPSTMVSKPPPGFDMGQKSNVLPHHTGDGSKAIPTAAEAVQDLIDFDDNAEDDVSIVERLQPQQSKPVKKYTMRQQKGKKKGGGSQGKKTPKTNKSDVSLPKPDPLPTPKRKPPTKSQVPQLESFSKHGGASLSSEQGVADANTAMKTVAQASTKIGSFLKQLDSEHHIQGAQVVVQFGTILINHKEDKDFCQGVYDVAKMETKIQTAGCKLQTEMLTRLTTSLTDVHAIFSAFPGSEVIGSVRYEMHVKDSKGSPYIIQFHEQRAPHGCTVLPASDTIGTAYLHYPMHIFDAKVTVEKTLLENTNDLFSSARQLIETLHTFDRAPSFRGLAPKNAFTIDKVYAKRTFTKTGAHGIKMLVTEVQDLFIQPLDSTYYNFRAEARSKEDMVRDQRFWYEACLTLKTEGLGDWDPLQGVVDGVVSSIDGVGFGNEGPWVRSAMPEAKKNDGSVGWYW